MADDLAAFLRARLDREADDVDLISGGGYEPDIWRPEDPRDVTVTADDGGDDRLHVSEVWAYSYCIGEQPSEAGRDDSHPVAVVQAGRNEHLHVARYDPRRIAAEIEAKRATLAWLDALDARIVDVNWWNSPETDDVRRQMALPYADHPDYREEWKP